MQLASKKIYKFKKRHFAFIYFAFFVIFCFNVHLKFLDFCEFLIQDQYILKVLKNYEKSKNNKHYYVLHLAYKNVIIYTTTKQKINSNKISIKFAAKNKLDFYDYLKARFYLPNYQIQEEKNEDENALITYFKKQHDNQKMQEFFLALFFAKPISNELRNDVNYYSIAHLLAISGYHLGLIYSILFFALMYFYKYLQKRFFPYRSIHLDLAVVIFICLFFYFILIGQVASFFRSFIMAIVAFYFAIKSIKLLSFSHLFLCFTLCISINPSFLFNVGFFFSCLGVFYVFLFLYHFKFKSLLYALYFESFVFLAMIIPVLYFFPLISFQQFLAILITPLFILFYPLALFLHIINCGALFDKYLLAFLAFKMAGAYFHLKFQYLLLYLFLSFLAIFNKYLLIIISIINILCFIILL